MYIPFRRSSVSRPLVFIVGLAAVFLLWALDYLVLGPEMTITLLYLAPISFVAWWAGRTNGIVIALVSALGWFSVHVAQNMFFSHSIISYINLTAKLAAYIGTVFVVSALRRSLDRERLLSGTDYLTGAVNRRAFIAVLNDELSRARRYGRPITIVFMDIDNFKTINDTCGHAAGDALLRETAATIGRSLRTTDRTARMGGDEFAILLPEIEPGASDITVRKIKKRLAEMVQRNEWPVTFSFGIVTCRQQRYTAEQLIALADAAMYNVKQRGKNNIYHMPCPVDREPV